jgi:dolichyl-diphosphooligosaccharide--protein glycosyltransferase
VNTYSLEYLLYNGAERFFTWFDYMSWYPLGRPVGTTIYPGMQFTAVWIYKYVFSSFSTNEKNNFWLCQYIHNLSNQIAPR